MARANKTRATEIESNQGELVINSEEVNGSQSVGFADLKRLIIGKKVKKIALEFFKNCPKLESIEIEKGNKNFTFADGILYGADKKALTFVGEPCVPDGLNEINFDVFFARGKLEVENFYIGKSLKKIISAYRDFNIKNITLSDKNKHFYLESGCLYQNGSGEILLGCENSVIGKSATTIGHSAFRACAMKSVDIIADNLNRIDKCAFFDCKNLESINLPQSVAKINYGAFHGCSSLKTIELPHELRNIAEHVFYKSGLESIKVANNIEKIDEYAFGYCEKLREIAIGGSVKAIGRGAFYNCVNLTKITMSNNVAKIGDNAFSECVKLKEINLPQALIDIPQDCFESCKALKHITLPKSVTSVGYGAFFNCYSLERINLDNVTEIDEIAFKNCKSLTDVGNLENVKNKKKNAFAGCKNLDALPKPKAKPLNKELYSCYTVDEINEKFKPKALVDFTTWTLEEVYVRLIKAGIYESKNYVIASYKSNKFTAEYCIEITDGVSIDERFADFGYPWFRCNVYDSDSDRFIAVKKALI